MVATSQAVCAKDRVLNLEALTSESGIPFWHVEDHTLPIATIHFAFRGVGSTLDPEGKTGLAQLVSNTMDEGASDRDAHAFQDTLQTNAIDLMFNSTRDNYTGKLKTLKQTLPLASELLKDAIHSPRFDEEAVNRMRQANMMRIKSSLSNSQWVGSRMANDVYFGDHPYANNSGGTLSGLMAITPDDMHGFVKKYLTRDRLVIATAGDLSVDEAKSLVDEIFADLPVAQSSEAQTLSMTTPPTEPQYAAFEMDSPQSSVQMIWPTEIDKEHPDYYAYRVMNHILGGGGFSSYLMDEVREKKGLTYGIYSHPVIMDYTNYITIESATAPESVAPMTEAINEVLELMKHGEIDPQLLSDAKSYLIGSLPLRFSSTLSLSGAAMRMQLDGRSIKALDEWDDHINAVTMADVQRVARDIFDDVIPKTTVIAGAVPDDVNARKITDLPGVQ